MDKLEYGFNNFKLAQNSQLRVEENLNKLLSVIVTIVVAVLSFSLTQEATAKTATFIIVLTMSIIGFLLAHLMYKRVMYYNALKYEILNILKEESGEEHWLKARTIAKRNSPRKYKRWGGMVEIMWKTIFAIIGLTSLVLIGVQGCSGIGENLEPGADYLAAPAIATLDDTPERPGHLVWVAEVDGEWDLYLRETPDGETLRLTTDPAWDWGPAPSPDGRRLAWLSTRDGAEDIYLAELTPVGLTNIERLTDDPHREGFLTWGSGADKALYYSALDYDGTGKLEFYDIYRLDPAGGGPERITDRPGMFYA
ncbi:MAG: hypothetical protein GF403_00225, partial [Candidatus Coatesbacteria bacterium]|nr:hypothetical protein [Candidatus Coatesbacteria bacterium]